MKKLSIVIVFGLIISILCGCGAGKENKQKSLGDLPTVTVGCDNYSPFSFMDANGNMTGIDVELAREAEYHWAGPYMRSHQVVAVNEDSDIQTLEDLEGKVMAVQSTTKPEDIIRSHDGTLPELRKVISVQKRDLIFILLSKGYVDALAAHDTSVDQFMEDSGLKFRILEEPLQTVDLGVAFDKADTRGLNIQLTDTLKEMQKDGTVKQIISKYLLNADSYLEEE